MHGGHFTLIKHSHHILIIIDLMWWLGIFRWCEVIRSIDDAAIIQFKFTLHHRSLDLLKDSAGWTSSRRSGFLVTLCCFLNLFLLLHSDFFNLVRNCYCCSKLLFTIRFFYLVMLSLLIIIVLNLIEWLSLIVSSRSRVHCRIFTHFDTTIQIFHKVKIFECRALRLTVGLALGKIRLAWLSSYGIFVFLLIWFFIPRKTLKLCLRLCILDFDVTYTSEVFFEVRFLCLFSSNGHNSHVVLMW